MSEKQELVLRVSRSQMRMLEFVARRYGMPVDKAVLAVCKAEAEEMAKGDRWSRPGAQPPNTRDTRSKE